jgi:hypothetical protein
VKKGGREERTGERRESGVAAVEQRARGVVVASSDSVLSFLCSSCCNDVDNLTLSY